MIKIGKTVILTDNEAPFKGECTADVMNKAHNVISIVIDDETQRESVKIIKQRYVIRFKELNKIFINK